MLAPSAVESIASRFRERLGANAQRLDQIIKLLTKEGDANLGILLQALYPGESDPSAQAKLRQLRLAINNAAKRAGVAFTFTTDTKNRAQPSDRRVWFEGDDLSIEAAEHAFNTAKQEINLPEKVLPASAGVLFGSQIYIRFDEKYRPDAAQLSTNLLPLCHASNIKIALQHDIPSDGRYAKSLVQIGLGESLTDRRLQFEREAHVILDLLTLGYQTPAPTAGPAAVIPVLLHSAAKTSDTKVFQYQTAKKQMAFDECRNDRERREFAAALFAQVSGVLGKPWSVSQDFFLASNLKANQYAEAAASRFRLDPTQPEQAQGMERLPALGLLTQWFEDPNSPRFCVLFGQLGMGKTTTAAEFVDQVWQKRKEEPTRPPAIFFDLRDLAAGVALEELDKILDSLLRAKASRAQGTPPLTCKDVYQLAANGALIVFDGMDEVLVHLTDKDGQIFTRKLLRLADNPAARILFTCRTHYFETFQLQASHFTGHDRHSVGEADYFGLLLLPFDENQIHTYLRQTLGAAEGDRAYEFLSQVHDLQGLAQSPYLLSLIVGQFARIEELHAKGKTVNSFTLYRLFVEQWLLRDTGKHQLTSAHKQLFMEHLAAEMLRSGERKWQSTRLDDGLLEWLAGNPRVAQHYGSSKDEKNLLKQDLHTATFLVREEGSAEFRFAHTSLQEYFIACHLRRALEESHPEAWAVSGVSRETLDFLGQSLQEQSSIKALEGLATLRDAYRHAASELAFRYFLRSHAESYPCPSARGFQLQGASLWELEVDFVNCSQLDLSRMDVRGADLGNSFWRNCRLHGACFDHADLSRSQWEHCDFEGSRWQLARLGAALFYRCSGLVQRWTQQQERESALLQCGQKVVRPVSAARAEVQLDGRVTSVSWSGDGRLLATGSLDGSAKIWEAETGRCLLTLEGHRDSVTSVSWSGDGRLLATGSDDGSAKIWEAETGRCLRTLEGHRRSVTSVSWSGDGRLLATGSHDSSAKIWETETGRCLRTLEGHRASVMSVSWSGDGRLLATGSDDGSAKIWEAETGRCLRTLEGHQFPVTSVSWSGDGRLLATGSYDRSAKIWEAETGRCLRTLEGHQDYVRSVSWSGDGRLLATGSDDKSAKIWEAETGRCLRTLEGHRDYVRSVSWSGDGRLLATGSDDKSAKIWEAETGRCLRTLEGHQDYVMSVSWSGDGRLLATGSYDSSAKIWDAETGRCLRTLEGHQDIVMSVSWSGDGRLLATGSVDGSAKIWEAETGRCLRSLEGHQTPVASVSWSGDGRLLATGSDDGSAKIWEAETGRCLRTLEGHQDYVRSVSWSGDGRLLATGSDDRSAKIWDADTGRCLRTLEGHQRYLTSVSWSGDGRLLATGSLDSSAKIWEAETGRCLHTLEGHHSRVTSVSWSGDGRLLATGSYDRSAKIWDAKTGRCLRTIVNPLGNNPDVAWHGDRLALCGDGATIVDARTGEELGPRLYHLKAPHGQPTHVAIDPRTNQVLHHGADAWRSIGYVVKRQNGYHWESIAAFEDAVGPPAGTDGTTPPAPVD